VTANSEGTQMQTSERSTL